MGCWGRYADEAGYPEGYPPEGFDPRAPAGWEGWEEPEENWVGPARGAHTRTHEQSGNDKTMIKHH